MNGTRQLQDKSLRKIRVFVSYSWDSEEHKAWVRKLAEDLDEYHELLVTWDGFDLDELSDKNQFMESGLYEADFVLAIITKRYSQKADERNAGVGVETYITTGMHWDQLARSQTSNVIIIQREIDSTPRYLKGKLYIDFSRNTDYATSLSRLLQVLKGESRIPRPPKRLSLDADSRAYSFTRVEDVIRINHKNRRAITSGSEGTDFSGGNKIKFEIWETKSPISAYFLALFSNITISQTVIRAAEILKSNAIKISEITVLRPSPGEKGFIERQFEECGYPMVVHEFTYASYIWAFCIDDQLKHAPIHNVIPNYTDQALVVPSRVGPHKEDSAREFFKSAISSTPTPTAHILIAPGGMGKTSLCLAVFYDLINIKDGHLSVVLIQAESLRKYFANEGLANVHINSVYGLYEFYAKAQGYAHIYDPTTFDLAVLCGNIIVIIDGLDELVSLLQERLELDKFLKSIETLHDELGSSHFLITTRNSLLIDDRRLSALGMTRYELLGFDEANCTRYARRRFSKYASAENLSSKLERQLSSIQLQESSGRVIPFFVDILATILEEELNEDRDSRFEVSYQATPYPSNNELTDHIVYSVLRREEVRHELGISVSQVASLLSELIVDFGECIPSAEAIERLTLLYDEQANDLFSKVSLNPLLIPQADTLKLRYGFLNDYFSVLYLIDSLIQHSGTWDFVKCLSRLNAPESTEFKEVLRYFSNRKDEFHLHAKAAISTLRKYALSKEHAAMPKTEVARRATSAVLRLHATVCSVSYSNPTDCLLDLLDARNSNGVGRTVEGLFIYGEFPIIDFTNLTVLNSRFSGYIKFPKCKFTNTKFLFTRFDRCGGTQPANESLASVVFDSSCDLGDLSQTLQMIRTGKAAEDAMVEADVKKFFHCFFKGDRFVDTKTAHMKFSSRLPGLSLDTFDRLLKQGYLQVKTKKHDENYYEVSESLRSSVYRFLVNNYVDGKIRGFFEFVR